MSRPETQPMTPWRLAVRVGVLALAAGLALATLRLIVVQPLVGEAPPCDRAYVRMFDQPRTKVGTVIAASDAQAWAALAMDPTFSDTAAFCDGTPELVYRSSRPLFGWLVWAGSLGQPDLVPASLIVWCALGIGVLGFASVLLAAQIGRMPKHGIATLALPGAAYGVLLLGPEPLAVGLTLLGLVCWKLQPRRSIAAVALFSAAVLMRELLLVVPIVLGIHSLVIDRRRFRDVMILIVPVGIYAGWVASLYLRYHYLPKTDGPNRWEGTSAPFVGLLQALPNNPETGAALLAMVILVILAVRRDARSELTWCALLLGAISIVMGRGVWQLEPFRVFLPLFVFALLVALPMRTTPTRPAKVAPT